MTDRGDEQLAALASAGDELAFASLIERHRRALLAHARRMVGIERAEDVQQEALTRAWRALAAGTVPNNPAAWLHRIVHNVALSELRHRSPACEPLDESLVSPASTSDEADRRLAVRAMLSGLSQLPARQRRALLAGELDGRSRREIAAELGLSEGAVRALVHRARSRLRAAAAVVSPWGVGPRLVRLVRFGGWAQANGGSGAGRAGAEATVAGGLMSGALAKVGAAVVLAGGVVGALGGGLLLGSHPHVVAISAVGGRAAHPIRSPAVSGTTITSAARLGLTDHRPTTAPTVVGRPAAMKGLRGHVASGQRGHSAHLQYLGGAGPRSYQSPDSSQRDGSGDGARTGEPTGRGGGDAAQGELGNGGADQHHGDQGNGSTTASSPSSSGSGSDTGSSDTASGSDTGSSGAASGSDGGSSGASTSGSLPVGSSGGNAGTSTGGSSGTSTGGDSSAASGGDSSASTGGSSDATTGGESGTSTGGN